MKRVTMYIAVLLLLSQSAQTQEIAALLEIPEYAIESPYQVQDLRYYNAFQIIRSVPESIQRDIFTNPEKNLKALVEYLTDGIDDQAIALKIIHDWICDNIYGDSYNKNPVGDPYEVLRARTTVCGGFTNLMLTMARFADIPIFRASGEMKGGGKGPGGVPIPIGSSMGHSSTAVIINGGFYFIDTANDALKTFTREGEYENMGYRNLFFLIAPAHFSGVFYPNYLSINVSDNRSEPELKKYHFTTVDRVAFGCEPDFDLWLPGEGLSQLMISHTSHDFEELGLSFVESPPVTFDTKDAPVEIRLNTNGLNLYGVMATRDSSYWEYPESIPHDNGDLTFSCNPQKPGQYYFSISAIFAEGAYKWLFLSIVEK